MNPKKTGPAWIENTHDLAEWLLRLPSTTEGITVAELVESLLQGPPEDWKKCRTCRKIFSADFYDSVPATRDGYRAICKACRRKERNKQARRRRGNKRAMRNPADLLEIQSHRKAAGLGPLPYGKDAPKRGRPKNNPDPFVANPPRPRVGSVNYELEEVSDG
jgi:hypothetical protein